MAPEECDRLAVDKVDATVLKDVADEARNHPVRASVDLSRKLEGADIAVTRCDDNDLCLRAYAF
jgi:hypothetical protein